MSDEEELFQDGNFTDYWLGCPTYDNSFIADNERWSSAEEVVRAVRNREIPEWTPYRDMIGKIITDRPNAIDRAGGLKDISPEFHFVRSQLIKRGQLGAFTDTGR
jgi:hypothetical protein